MKKPGFIFLTTIVIMSVLFLVLGAIFTNIIVSLHLKEKSDKQELGMQAIVRFLETGEETEKLQINKQVEKVQIANKNLKKIIIKISEKKKDKAIVNLIYYEE